MNEVTEANTLFSSTLQLYKERVTNDSSEPWTPTERLAVRHLLDNALTYLVDVKAMREVPRARNLSIDQRRLISSLKKHRQALWIEFPRLLYSEQGKRVLRRQSPQREGKRERWKRFNVDKEIAALFYYFPALEDAQMDFSPPSFPGFRLDLISSDGHLFDSFSYNARLNEWGLVVQGCEHCTKVEQPNLLKEFPALACQQCKPYLNTWRNQFNQCLTLIQNNDYRQGPIPAR